MNNFYFVSFFTGTVIIYVLTFLIFSSGDSGYPLRPWLMTPCLNPAPGSREAEYNSKHSTARVVIENTFGRLKNRWRCLCKDRVLHYHPTKCAKIITACSVLYNLALDYGVPEPEEPQGNSTKNQYQILNCSLSIAINPFIPLQNQMLMEENILK